MSVAPGNVCCVCLFVFACVLCSYFLLLGNAMHLQQLSKGFSIYWRHVLSYFGPSQSLSFKTHFCTEFNLVYFNPDMVSCPYLLSLSTIVSFITYTCHLCSLSPASLASNQPHHIHLFPVYISTSLPHLLCAMLYSVLLVFWLYVVFFGFVAFYFFLWVLGQALSIFYFYLRWNWSSVSVLCALLAFLSHETCDKQTIDEVKTANWAVTLSSFIVKTGQILGVKTELKHVSC